ncbi:hypothetical protein [uncultured Nostoc sp.]|uniref:hypothetical protein n=1 Tax=uncultured Nostoc sp. TaxID=340711 RepID=UPI0035CB58F5
MLEISDRMIQGQAIYIPRHKQFVANLLLSPSVSVAVVDALTSLVKVYTADSLLKEMEFEFPVTEFAQVDAAIAQALGLPITAIKQVIRYRIEN